MYPILSALLHFIIDIESIYHIIIELFEINDLRAPYVYVHVCYGHCLAIHGAFVINLCLWTSNTNL